MQFGQFDVFPIETGLFRLDGGAMFGVVPRNLWERTNPPDEKNRILMALRTLLLRSGERTILVDTGVGYKNSEKFHSIYGIDPAGFSLEDGLARQGVSPGDVTDVILTHLHFDHAGGAVRKSGDDLVPTFPNAACYVQKTHWDWAMNPSDRDKASFLPENYMPIQEHGMLRIIDGDTELFPGVSVEMMNGHTFGQQLVRIRDDNRSMVFCGDLIPMAGHIPAPYIMGYDLQPLVTLQEKVPFLERAVENKDILVFEHDPSAQAAIAVKGDHGFRLTKAGTFDEMVALQRSLAEG